MTPILTRRSVLTGLLAAPIVCRRGLLMRVKSVLVPEPRYILGLDRFVTTSSTFVVVAQKIGDRIHVLENLNVPDRDLRTLTIMEYMERRLKVAPPTASC